MEGGKEAEEEGREARGRCAGGPGLDIWVYGGEYPPGPHLYAGPTEMNVG